MGQQTARVMMASAVTLMMTGCGGGDSTSFSLLATGQTFKQATVNSKIDVLWVVDDSGSMQPLQDNLTSNFNSFISQFVDKKYDFQVGVTGTTSYRSAPFFLNDPNLAKFRDGAASHSGVFMITPDTPDLLNVFITNATLGVTGGGDERAFSSMRAALDSDLNAGFLRDDSFLAIVILSDEDDFSNPTRPTNSYVGGDHNYAQVGLESVDSYVSYLDGLTGSTPSKRRYSVSAITIKDETCRAAYVAQSSTAIVGARYIELANKTDGVLGSVCDVSFADSLVAIQQRIIELSTQFYLDGEPQEETIKVFVNGKVVPKHAVHGWSYNPVSNAIVFHGNSIPSSGVSINVTFDPVKLTF